MKKIFISTVFNLFLLTLVSNAHIVNLNTGLEYTSIQAVIEAPETSAGHILIISSGIFSENITINKRTKLIVSAL